MGRKNIQTSPGILTLVSLFFIVGYFTQLIKSLSTISVLFSVEYSKQGFWNAIFSGSCLLSLVIAFDETTLSLGSTCAIELRSIPPFIGSSNLCDTSKKN